MQAAQAALDDEPAFRRTLEEALRAVGERDLEACVVVVDDDQRAVVARHLGAHAIAWNVEIRDWSLAALGVAHEVGWPLAKASELVPAVDMRLRHVFALEIATITSADVGPPIRLHGELDDAQRARVVITLTPDGDLASVERVTPGPAEERFVRALAEQGAIAPPGEPMPPGSTHTIETDAQGAPVVKRKRFSLF